VLPLTAIESYAITALLERSLFCAAVIDSFDEYRAEVQCCSLLNVTRRKDSPMRWTLALVALLSASAGEAAAQGKGIRLWNLTTATVSEFQLSPAGKNEWGPNQTLNDKDKEVDHDERLRITGVEPGKYDAKVGYRGSKHCFVRGIEIKADAVFSIADKDLKDCNK
jgi:hypothetical protein